MDDIFQEVPPERPLHELGDVAGRVHQLPIVDVRTIPHDPQLAQDRMLVYMILFLSFARYCHE